MPDLSVRENNPVVNIDIECVRVPLLSGVSIVSNFCFYLEKRVGELIDCKGYMTISV